MGLSGMQRAELWWSPRGRFCCSMGAVGIALYTAHSCFPSQSCTSRFIRKLRVQSCPLPKPSVSVASCSMSTEACWSQICETSLDLLGAGGVHCAGLRGCASCSLSLCFSPCLPLQAVSWLGNQPAHGMCTLLVCPTCPTWARSQL